jgi:hypothetical protein
MATPNEKSLTADNLETILTRVLEAARVAPAVPIDPTVNVKEAVAREVKGLNDLIERDRQHQTEMQRHREKCDLEVAKLRDKLDEKESGRIDAIAAAERSRIDASFKAGTDALALASEKQAAAAATLAQSVVTSAEVLRAAQAASQATTTAAIRALEQNQYQSGGRDVGRLEQRTEARAVTTEGRQSNAALYAAIGAGISILLFLMAVVTFIIARTGA